MPTVSRTLRDRHEVFNELPDQQRKAWNEPDVHCPAFVLLAGLPRAVSGNRFDAWGLSGAMRRNGSDLNPECVKDLAE